MTRRSASLVTVATVVGIWRGTTSPAAASGAALTGDTGSLVTVGTVGRMTRGTGGAGSAAGGGPTGGIGSRGLMGAVLVVAGRARAPASGNGAGTGRGPPIRPLAGWARRSPAGTGRPSRVSSLLSCASISPLSRPAFFRRAWTSARIFGVAEPSAKSALCSSPRLRSAKREVPTPAWRVESASIFAPAGSVVSSSFTTWVRGLRP